MDPVSGIVAAVVLVTLANRLPGLVADLVHAARGEESPTRAARAKRLAQSGVEPGEGGAARQYWAGVWRDAWLDAEKNRTTRRDKRRAEADANPGQASRWQQRRTAWAERAAEAAAAVTDRWRGAEPLDPTGHVHPTPRTPPAGGEATGQTDTPHPQPAPADAQADRAPIWATASLGSSTGPAAGTTAPAPQPTPAYAGTGIAPTAPQEGTASMSTALATGNVTGAASAAAQARALRNAMNDATALYAAELRRIRVSLQHLGEAALNDVQLHGRAIPVQHLSDAAGQLDQLRTQAFTSAQQVSGWLGAAAKAFDVVAS